MSANHVLQRIMGRQIQPGLRFFGQAIDGDVDLDVDGLPDVVIGSQDTAVVLRCRYCVSGAGVQGSTYETTTILFLKYQFNSYHSGPNLSSMSWLNCLFNLKR